MGFLLDVTGVSDSIEYSFSSSESNLARLKIVAKDAAGLVAADSSTDSFILMAITENLNILKTNNRQYRINNVSDNIIQFSNPLIVGDQVDILQLNGKVIYSTLISSDNVDKIDLPNISMGAYLVRLVRNNVIVFKSTLYWR